MAVCLPGGRADDPADAVVYNKDSVAHCAQQFSGKPFIKGVTS